MRVIQQYAEMIPQEPGLNGLYKQIEMAARTCYQSEMKKDKGIVQRLINNDHTAMLEHGTVYMKTEDLSARLRYENDPYSAVVMYNDIAYITTNYRVIIENRWNEDMKLMCDPEWQHQRRHTIKLVTNLQVATECLRHRKMSFAMESSRYCAYDKEKFGDELTFILPCWFNDNTPQVDIIEWSNACQDAENHYMRMRAKSIPAEQCAQFLPKSSKTTLVMTGFESDWKHFLDLRYYEKTGKVHPQMKEMATIIFNLLDNEHPES